MVVRWRKAGTESDSREGKGRVHQVQKNEGATGQGQGRNRAGLVMALSGPDPAVAGSAPRPVMLQCKCQSSQMLTCCTECVGGVIKVVEVDRKATTM